jgi:hypothetical protein
MGEWDVVSTKPVSKNDGWEVISTKPITAVPVSGKRDLGADEPITSQWYNPTVTEAISGAYKGAANLGRQAGSLINSAIEPVLAGTKRIVNSEFGEPIRQSVSGIADMYKGSEMYQAQKNISDSIPVAPKSSEALREGIDILNLIPVIGAGKVVGGKLAQAALSAQFPGRAKIISALTKEPDLDTAIKQIIRSPKMGIERNVSQAKTAFSVLNIEPTETSAKVLDKFAEGAKIHSKKVDDIFATDPKQYRLDELIKNTKVGNEVVRQNFVDSALTQLKELYSTIGDEISLKKVDQLAKLAETQGLTKVQINHLAREYGVEFKEKAFSKATNMPLTSTTAEKVELTRKGIKETARSGMGPEAEIADNELSAIINTRNLLRKSVEAVIAQGGKIDPKFIAQAAAEEIAITPIKRLLFKIGLSGIKSENLSILQLEDRVYRNIKVINKKLEKRGLPQIDAEPSVKETWGKGSSNYDDLREKMRYASANAPTPGGEIGKDITRYYPGSKKDPYASAQQGGIGNLIPGETRVNYPQPIIESHILRNKPVTNYTDIPDIVGARPPITRLPSIQDELKRYIQLQKYRKGK